MHAGDRPQERVEFQKDRKEVGRETAEKEKRGNALPIMGIRLKKKKKSEKATSHKPTGKKG